MNVADTPPSLASQHPQASVPATKSSFNANPCRSEPARDSAESAWMNVADTPRSRAGSLLQEIVCGH
ncbi:hypothetical protein EJA70_12650 [Pseudomonas sp. PB103]|nr:hypothetical protein EJA70_12650 [Pseudomonas sp. PB103]